MTLPISPIGQSSDNPTAEPGVVQVDLADPTGQIVTGAEFGLSTGQLDYTEYANANFQALANQYPVDLLRHNWDLNAMMDDIFPTRASATTPDFTNIDVYLSQQAKLTGFFNNTAGTQIVTLGFPSWLDISNKADQKLYANMVKLIAQHFHDMGETIDNYELVNEPDQSKIPDQPSYSVKDLAAIFNVVAPALKSVDPNYKLGGLTDSFMRASDLQTFFHDAGSNIGFVSWHQYVTSGSDGMTSQQQVTASMSEVTSNAAAVRSMMETAGISDSVPLFLGEYNLDYGNYDDPNNGNMVGAVAAAATTYGMIASNTNMTMGALWETANDSNYGVFGSGPNYQVDPVGVVLADLTKYMPGNIVPTTMPNDTPRLVGYTTEYKGGFSTALIDTDLSQGYTVDLSQDGLPSTGLSRIEVSNANPTGSATAVSDLSAVSVPAGGVVIITNEAPHGGTEFLGALACFAATTRIVTASGEVPIEALDRGDLVPTLRGVFAPIIWIGRRHIDLRRYRYSGSVCPVRIQSGAFGDNLPHRDLYLSPDHSVFVDRMLVPIRYLINGSTITQVEVDEITYYHIELAKHDVLLAEGLPCESYLDTGNRWSLERADTTGAVMHTESSATVGRKSAASSANAASPNTQNSSIGAACVGGRRFAVPPYSGLEIRVQRS